MATKKKGKSKTKGKAKAKAKPVPKSKQAAKAGKGKEVPKDPEPVNGKGKGPTVVACIVLCNMCGEANHVPASSTASGISCKCTRCENKIKITGAKLAKLRVAADAIKRANQLALIPSIMETQKRGQQQRATTKTALKFLVTPEQHTVIGLALEVARRMCNEEGRDWAGRSLELICGDFLASAPPDVIAKVQAEQEGGKAKDTKRTTANAN